MYRRTLLLAASIVVAFTASAVAATLEVPQNGGDASGIGYFSGWKCPPNDNISIVVDGGAPIPVPSGVRRGDTATACGNDGRNGFISQVNFNLLGEGQHTAVARQNGVAFAQSTFHVTTFGQNFMTGASGVYVLPNFPQAGQATTVEWSQGAQNFIITDATGGPSPSPSPNPTPTPAPGGPSQVRYRSALSCFDFPIFYSKLEANGYSWESSGLSFSPYKTVTRTTLGPFSESNSSSCGNNYYPGTFNLPPGRRYALLQTFMSGSVILQLSDEGPAAQSVDPDSDVSVMGDGLGQAIAALFAAPADDAKSESVGRD